MSAVDAVLRIVVFDLSSLFWRYAMGNPKEVDAPTRLTLGTIRRLSEGFDRVVIATDPGPDEQTWKPQKSWRTALDANYKSKRPERSPAHWEQLRRIIERLDRDGSHVFRSPQFEADAPPGAKDLWYEADDVIGSVVSWAIEQNPMPRVRIVSSDKDMCQLLCDGIELQKPDSGETVTFADVPKKLGVPAGKVVEYLALAGDTSDGYKPFPGLPAGPDGKGGTPGVGDKTAVELVREFGSAISAVSALESWQGEKHERYARNIIDAIKRGGMKAAVLGLQLAEIRRDVPIDCATILQRREPTPEPATAWDNGDWSDEPAPVAQAPESGPRSAGGATTAQAPVAPAAPPAPTSAPRTVEQKADASMTRVTVPETAMALSTEAAIVDPRDPSWSLALQPRTAQEAWTMAKHLHASNLYEKKFSSTQAIWTVILLGREHGLSALSALQSMTLIEGKVEMDAGLIVAKVLRSGAAKYFTLVESDDEHATWKTWRVGDEEPMSMSFTIREAERRGVFVVRDGRRVTKWGKESNWERMPDVMCMWRAATKLARAKYSDVVRGLYGTGEIREAAQVVDAEFEAA